MLLDQEVNEVHLVGERHAFFELMDLGGGNCRT